MAIVAEYMKKKILSIAQGEILVSSLKQKVLYDFSLVFNQNDQISGQIKSSFYGYCDTDI